MTHICVSKPTIVGSDNGLSPGRRLDIIWFNAGIMLIRPLGTNFSEILIEIHNATFSLKKMHLQISSGNGGHFVSASVCWQIIYHEPLGISASPITIIDSLTPNVLLFLHEWYRGTYDHECICRLHDIEALSVMMTSSNGNIFRVTGPLCGEFTGPGEFPTQRPVTQNKRLSKQTWGWWFETLSWSLWRHCNVLLTLYAWNPPVNDRFSHTKDLWCGRYLEGFLCCDFFNPDKSLKKNQSSLWWYTWQKVLVANFQRQNFRRSMWYLPGMIPVQFICFYVKMTKISADVADRRRSV